MKKDDLTQIGYIGPSRMKLLNKFGIMTIRQLDEMPVEQLSKIESLGVFYAERIKAALNAYYGKALPERKLPSHEEKIEDISGKLRKKTKTLKKRLDRLLEDMKPLWKKKYLELYVAFKKRAARLKIHLETLDQQLGDLSQETIKEIIPRTDALIAACKKIGEKPKKKKYEKITKEIRSFSKMLKDRCA